MSDWLSRSSNKHDLQEDKRTVQNQFKFYRYEIMFLLLQLIVVICLGLSLLSEEAETGSAKATSPSYLAGVLKRARDSHDLQWQTFRSNIPILLVLMIGWYFIASRIEVIKNEKAWILGLAMTSYCYRSDILFLGLLVILWYWFSVSCYRWKYFVSACWTIVIVLLYINEATNHFEALSFLVGKLMPWDVLSSSQRQMSFGQILNLMVLKFLSFALDLERGNQTEDLNLHLKKCDECTAEEYCLKGRNFIQPQNFGFLNYMNFILFAPTFFAGPPLGYKNFLSFRSMPSSKRPEIFKFILLLISFELYQHFFPVMNFSHETSLIKVELITLFHLVFIWYKFLIIWRFHRAWAQLYGINVIDNMSRCIMNNYCFEGFWRMWHRGFNQWLIRYLYIPLGGNKSLFSVVVAVVFVAFWHDHTLNIVVWALGIILCILPEILIKRYVNKNYSHLFREHWFKYLCAFVASIYIFCLVLINIAGFGYGAEKIGLVWDKMKQEWAELILSLYVITGVVILMFYIRTREGHKINY